MGISNEERLVINSEIQRRGKNMVVAYLLLIFLGTIGVHRFYLGKVGTGVTMLVLSVIGWMTSWLIVGFIPLAVVWVWVLVDLFLIPGIIEKDHQKIEQAMISNMNVMK